MMAPWEGTHSNRITARPLTSSLDNLINVESNCSSWNVFDRKCVGGQSLDGGQIDQLFEQIPTSASDRLDRDRTANEAGHRDLDRPGIAAVAQDQRDPSVMERCQSDGERRCIADRVQHDVHLVVAIHRRTVYHFLHAGALCQQHRIVGAGFGRQFDGGRIPIGAYDLDIPIAEDALHQMDAEQLDAASASQHQQITEAADSDGLLEERPRFQDGRVDFQRAGR